MQKWGIFTCKKHLCYQSTACYSLTLVKFFGNFYNKGRKITIGENVIMSVYATIFLTIVATVISQIVTKKGMLLAGQMPSTPIDTLTFLIKTMILNPYVLGGLLLSVIASMSWIATLARTNLSFAYPFMSLAFPLVLLFAGFIFGETISSVRWVGMIIIMIGLVMVSKG